MGKIRGDVEAVGTANLLQMLSMGHCEGILIVNRNLNKKVIQFGPAGMRLVTSGARQSQPLGEILVRSGKITRPQVDELLEEQRRTGAHLGVLALKRGLLAKEDVEKSLQEHIAEEIFDLLSWTGATFEFTGTPGEPSPAGEGPLSDLTLDADVMTVILQASRLADELSRIRELIPNVQMVPVRLAEIPVAPEDDGLPSGVLLAVLPLIDNRRTVGQIIDESLYPKFQVLGALYELVQRGGLEIRDTQGATVVRRRLTVPLLPTAARDRTLLVVSDPAETRRPLGAVLRGAGYAILEASASSDFAEIFAQNRVDAVVLEVSIETEGGLELCARLRGASSTPFVACSRSANRQAVINAARSGARYVLLQPVKEDLLRERLSEMAKD